MSKSQPFDRRPSTAFTHSTYLGNRPSTTHRFEASAPEYPERNHLFASEFDKKKVSKRRRKLLKETKLETDSLSKAITKECPGLNSSLLEDMINSEVTNEHLECIYITSVYVINNYISTGAPNSEEPDKLSEFTNQLIPLKSKVKTELGKMAKSISSPEYAINVIIVEAENLTPMDTDGLSDPFCKVWVNKNKEFMKETTVKDHTLHPYWNESLCVPFSDVDKDILHIEVWDKDPTGVGSNLRDMRNIRGLRGFGFYCRECCHNIICCHSGNVDDFIGKVDLSLKEINSSGFEDVITLKSGKGKDISGRLHFIAQFQVLRSKCILNSLKRHLLLFRIILHHSLKHHKSSNFSINRWDQILSPAAITIMLQHSLQSSLNPAEDAMCRFIVFVDLTRNKQFINYKFLFNMMEDTYECMQQLLSIDYNIESSLEDLYKITVDSVYDACISAIDVFHSCDLTDESKCLEWEFMLRCIRICHDISGKDLLETALKSEAVNWFEQVAETVQSMDPKRKAHFIKKTIAFISSFHLSADHVINKVFPDKSYTHFVFDVLNTALGECFKPYIVKISKESISFLGEVREEKINDAIDIFIKIKELNEYFCKILELTESGLQIESFRDWFGSTAIEDWFKYKQEIIMQKIAKIVESDIFENKIVECAGRLEKQSLSAMQTTNLLQKELIYLWKLVCHPQYAEYDSIFLETLHLSCIKYAECMLDIVHSQNIAYNFRTHGKLKLCVMANNLWSLAMFVKKTITDTVFTVPSECHDTKFCLKLICFIICTDISKELESDIEGNIMKVASAQSKKKQTLAINLYTDKIRKLISIEAKNSMAFEVYLLFLREIWKFVISTVTFFKDLHKDSNTLTSLNICQRIFVKRPNVMMGLLAVLTETEKLCFIDPQGKLKRFMWTDDFSALKHELQQLIFS